MVMERGVNAKRREKGHQTKIRNPQLASLPAFKPEIQTSEVRHQRLEAPGFLAPRSYRLPLCSLAEAPCSLLLAPCPHPPTTLLNSSSYRVTAECLE